MTTRLGICAHSELSKRVVEWPPEVLEAIVHVTLKAHDIKAENPRRCGILAEHGLLDPATREFTADGQVIADLLIHESWQQGDEVQDVLADYPRQTAGDVLDIGCSTGWTLRQLREPAPHKRVGVDLDVNALALASLLAQSEGQDIEFREASAHELPFRDASFDCVVCRNAITYTHQRTTIFEIARVLKPGGVVFLRFENPLFDLGEIILRRSLKAKICRLRDLLFGMLHAVIGWQLPPGIKHGPGRVYGSVRRIKSLLKASGCLVAETGPSRNCPTLFGRPNQTWLTAVRQGAVLAATAAQAKSSSTLIASDVQFGT